MNSLNGHSTLADRLKLQLDLSAAHVAEKNKPAPDRLPKTRTIGRILSAFRHDTKHRKLFLHAEGIDPTLVDPARIAHLLENLFSVVDFDEDKAFKHLENLTPLDQPYGLITKRMSDVEDEGMQWLWEQRIPLGDITLFSGDPGVGKTWTALYVASRITMGQPFFDAPPAFKERRDVLWMSLEDKDARIKERLKMLGADLTRVHTGTEMKISIPNKKGEGSQNVVTIWDLARGMDSLVKYLTEHPQVALVIIDPLLGFLGGNDGHGYAQVKQLLSPLVKAAWKHKASIIGLNHLNKSGDTKAQYRGMGSIAFNGTARANWTILKDNDSPLLSETCPCAGTFFLGKCNDRTCPEDQHGNHAFHTDKEKGLVWDGVVEGSADEALQAATPEKIGKKEKAMEWMKANMEPEKDYNGMLEKMVEAGFTANTVNLARKAMGIESHKVGKVWVWCLPSQPTPISGAQ